MARWTWPIDAAAIGTGSHSANTCDGGPPSSASTTPAAPLLLLLPDGGRHRDSGHHRGDARADATLLPHARPRVAWRRVPPAGGAYFRGLGGENSEPVGRGPARGLPPRRFFRMLIAV